MTNTEGAPAGPRPVSYSELDTFRQCPLKWHIGYAEGWKPVREKEAFRLGHIWHEIMERHYLTIKAFQDANVGGEKRSPRRGSMGETELLEQCAGEVGAVMDKLDDDTRDLMEWAYAGYVEAHGCDPDWRIIATEQRGQTALEPGGREIVYVIDLVVEDLDYGGVWIIDHKFPGDLMTDTEIDLDDQLGLYWFCWLTDPDDSQFTKVIRARVNGAMLNEARKKRNVGDQVPVPLFANGKPKGKPQTLEQRFRRTRTSRTVEELSAIAADALQVVKAMETGIIYSSPNPKQCGWKCDFKEVHILSRSSSIPMAEVLEDFDFKSRAMREAEQAEA
ncbi:exonuclease [Streptomyces phage Marky]|nr:exonuclease [Streptomyces phage Marky]